MKLPGWGKAAGSRGRHGRNHPFVAPATVTILPMLEDTLYLGQLSLFANSIVSHKRIELRPVQSHGECKMARIGHMGPPLCVLALSEDSGEVMKRNRLQSK